MKESDFVGFQELVEQMISKDPKSRLSAAELNMSKYKGTTVF